MRAREELDRVVEHVAGHTLPSRDAGRWGRGSVEGGWPAHPLQTIARQAWGLRVAFDLIKDRGKGGGSGTPRGVSSAESSASSSSVGGSSAQLDDAAAKEKEKAAKAARQVVHVCTEIHQTEGGYVKDLQTIIKIFRQPAREQGVLGEKDSPHIFSNIEDLLRCNTALLEALVLLEKADAGETLTIPKVTVPDGVRPGQGGKMPVRHDGVDYYVEIPRTKKAGDEFEAEVEINRVGIIAKAFIQVAPFFKLYTLYCSNYQQALKTLADCRQANPKLNSFLASAMKKPESHNLSLESFLIKPIQRLTKYPLFFKDLLRSMPADHPSREKLEKAAKLVSDVSQSVDSKLDDPGAKMAERLQPLGAEWLNLLAPHRELCHEVYCAVHATGGTRFNATAYVFTDLLLVCKRKDGGEVKPWLLVRLAQCMIGDNALLEETPSGHGLYDEKVEVESHEGGGGLFGKKKKETKNEWVLCMRVAHEEGWFLHCNTEDEMEELVNAFDNALAKLHEYDVDKRRRMIKRESKVQADSEDVLEELIERLRVQGVRKGNRAGEMARGHKLEGSTSINVKSVSKSKTPRAAAEAGPAWIPTGTFQPAPAIASEIDELDPLKPQQYVGRWFVVAHLPYFLERNAHNQTEELRLEEVDGKQRLVSEISFADGKADGPPRTLRRQGAVDAETGRDWRMRQKVGEVFLPQHAYTIVHFRVDDGAGGESMMVAHGDLEESVGHGLSYLWLLMRVSPAADNFQPKMMDDMIDLAKHIGFDVSNLRLVPHK